MDVCFVDLFWGRWYKSALLREYYGRFVGEKDGRLSP
jgi:hypothetical protein